MICNMKFKRDRVDRGDDDRVAQDGKEKRQKEDQSVIDCRSGRREGIQRTAAAT